MESCLLDKKINLIDTCLDYLASKNYYPYSVSLDVVDPRCKGYYFVGGENKTHENRYLVFCQADLEESDDISRYYLSDFMNDDLYALHSFYNLLRFTDQIRLYEHELIY